MEQMTYGWPVEMVVKAARKGLRIQSVPIRYRRRIGESKVTGTIARDNHGHILYVSGAIEIFIFIKDHYSGLCL